MAPDDPKKPDDSKGLSPEDSRLWEKVTTGILPIRKDLGAERKPIKLAAEKRPAKEVSRERQKEPLPDITPRFGIKETQQNQVPGSPAIDRRTQEKLQRGQMKIEAVLDLHGLRQNEAQEHLKRFLTDSYYAGRRCVLVITGKGSSGLGQEEKGILRRMLPVWLSEGPLSGIVLKHATAKPKDGGAGAFYVLLRRIR